MTTLTPKAISRNEYPLCSPSPLAGEGWDGGDRRGASLRALRLSFTPTLALPRQGGGNRGGRIFARNRLRKCLSVSQLVRYLTITHRLCVERGDFAGKRLVVVVK